MIEPTKATEPTEPTVVPAGDEPTTTAAGVGRVVLVDLVGDRPVRVLAIIGVALLLLSVLAQVAAEPVPGVDIVVGLFDVDNEQSLFTWYSAALLALAAVLALALSVAIPPQRRGWKATGAVLLLASVDEVASGHEHIGFVLRVLFDVSLFSWVVPAAIACVGAAWVAAPFVRSLHRGLRRGFVLSAAVYVGGALVLEALSGLALSAWGDTSVAYRVVAGLEEAAEASGVLLLIAHLLHELQTVGADVRVRPRRS